jgi:hypothetical protein
VASLPPNFPHGASDEEILEALESLGTDLLASGGNINSVLQLTPLVTIGQNELQSRQAKRSGDQLHAAIETFRTSSDHASRTLIRLTWVLVVLTIVLVGLTIVLLVRA